MSKIVIIGGGASGLIAAIYASVNNDVTILEKNDLCGKKILSTGNGKCNYFNAFIDIDNYNNESRDFLKDIITLENKQEILSFFESIGIIPVIKNGYFYPYSEQAISIRDALIKEAKNRKVNFIHNIIVNKITKDNNKFIINNDNNLIFDKVILATGSYAGIKQDKQNTVTGYDIAKSFSHKINKVLPSLVQLRGEEKYFKDWDGVRCSAKLALYENNTFIKSTSGQLQLTDYGISGICTFNLSGIISKGLFKKSEEVISINFLPFLNFNNIDEYLLWLENRNKVVKNRTISELLSGILNKKIIKVILKKVNINYNVCYNEISNSKRKDLITSLIDFRVNIVSTNSFDKCQVCTGGVDTQEISAKTFESKKCKGLYMTGEILDVDGECGGYNLAFAWISGMLAGKNI